MWKRLEGDRKGIRFFAPASTCGTKATRVQSRKDKNADH